MVSSKLFNFTLFKQIMDVADIDEATYGFILRMVFSHVNKVYGINLDAEITLTPAVGSTTTVLKVPLTVGLLVDQVVISGTQDSVITAVSSTLTETTITVSPAFSLVPTSIVIQLTLLPLDLQYALYQHTKFLFESQKKNLSVLDSVTDSAGNKATYKAKPPKMITEVYFEYSPNPAAFV